MEPVMNIGDWIPCKRWRSMHHIGHLNSTRAHILPAKGPWSYWCRHKQYRMKGKYRHIRHALRTESHLLTWLGVHSMWCEARMLVYEMSHWGCQSKRTSPTNFCIRTERGLSTISKQSLNNVTSALHIFAPGTRPGSANKAQTYGYRCTC